MKKQLHFKNLVQAVMLLAFLGLGQFGFGQTPVPMSSQPGVSYTENFADINNWTANFASGTGANRWGSYPITTGGSSNDGKRTTKSSTAFTTTTAGGIQKGTGNLVFLSTGSSTPSEAVAVDLLLDFTGVNAGTLSFDWSAIDNSSGTRPTSLRVFWSTDNSVFTELTAAQVIDVLSSTTGSRTNVTLPANFNNSPTARLRFYNHAGTITGGGNRDKIAIDNVTITGTTPITWDGSTSNSWLDATNWTPATVPDGTQDVLVGTGTPVLDTNFTLAAGKTLTVNGTGSLTVSPTNTLTIAGTAAFNGKDVILKSDATGTASIGQVTGTITGATNVTVERYIAGRRAFRFLTPGVTTTSSIYANWQNNGTATAGIGTHITGGAANGFDVTTTNNPSLHTYNSQATGTTTGFTAATNTDVATLKAGVGYRLLVRGDRTPSILTNPSAVNMNVPTTLSAKGTLTTGTVTFNSTDAINSPVLINDNNGNTQTNGYTLIGNPYASPVDWNAVNKTDVMNNAYYSWDPTLGTDAQRGRYVVYSADTGTANLYDGGASGQTNRQYLQSGQAVFIKNAAPTPAILTFNEDDKASTYSYVFRSSTEAVTTVGNSALYLTVYEPNELALGGSAIDGALALFGSDFSNALNGQDVDKLATSGENVAFVRESKNLAIETVAPVVANDELFVKTIQFQAGKTYTFKVNTQNFDTSVTAKMVDLYLNTETPIDLTQPSFVTFSTTADVNSYGSDRFKIVFADAALGNDTFTGSNVAVYPNPIVNNQFTIALPSSVAGKVTVAMSNMLGQVVYSASSEATSTMLIQPKQQLEEGVYIVSITNNGQVLQSKVVVRK